ncbi:MAG: LysR family transcriptional regulator [Chloroflexi bacterium]|nr:LysR family transcriptional regulator [Chloroflexota bacterium]
MDIQDLRYFVAVAETLNIAKAAKQLFISRQALSKAILDLENECGSALFFRSKGKLQITPLGRALQEKSIPIVDSFNEIEQLVSSGSLSQKCKICIAIGIGTLNTISPQLFTNFRLDYPEIELSINEVCDDDVRRDLQSQKADIGILNSTPEKLKGFDYVLVQGGEICFQISRKNPLSAKDQIKPEDLHNQPFVSLGERCDMHKVLMEKCRSVHSYPNLILETIDSNVANHMAYNNIAITLAIPPKDPVDDLPVRVIPMALGSTPWGTYAISRKGFELTAPLRLLINYLKEGE